MESSKERVEKELQRRKELGNQLVRQAVTVARLLGQKTGRGSGDFEYQDAQIRIITWGRDYGGNGWDHGVELYFAHNLVLKSNQRGNWGGLLAECYYPGEWEAYFETLIPRADAEQRRRKTMEDERRRQAKNAEKSRFGL